MGLSLEALEQQCPSKVEAKVDWLPEGERLFIHKLGIEDLLYFIDAANVNDDKVKTFEFAIELVAKSVGNEDGTLIFNSESGRLWLRKNIMKTMDLMQQSQEFNELRASSSASKNG